VSLWALVRLQLSCEVCARNSASPFFLTRIIRTLSRKRWKPQRLDSTRLSLICRPCPLKKTWSQTKQAVEKAGILVSGLVDHEIVAGGQIRTDDLRVMRPDAAFAESRTVPSSRFRVPAPADRIIRNAENLAVTHMQFAHLLARTEAPVKIATFSGRKSYLLGRGSR